MEYCGPRGIRYAEFLSWDQLSRDAALAWQARKASRCQCGQVPAEWRRYDLESGEPVLDEHGAHEALYPAEAPYLVEGAYCPACAELARAHDDSPYRDEPGWRFHYVPNPAYQQPPDPPEPSELLEEETAAERLAEDPPG